MTQQEKAKILGFEICEFGPDPTTCDECNYEHVQLYFRRTCLDVNDGEYRCLHCIEEEYDSNEANQKISQEEQNGA
jgi:hypothetical protein